jgi:hypothetical protein
VAGIQKGAQDTLRVEQGGEATRGLGGFKLLRGERGVCLGCGEVRPKE